MSRDQVVAAIKRRLPQQETPPASPWVEQAKDIGRGAVHGLARGLEELPQQIPFAGLRKAVTTATRPIAGAIAPYEPEAQAQKYVAQPEGPAGKATEHVARAAVTAPLQPGGPITKAVTTLGTGLGEYGGEEVARDLGLPPSVGGFIGGVLGGGVTGGGAQVAAERRARGMLPTSEANRHSAQQAYRNIEQAGLTVEPSAAQDLATGLRADLNRNLFSPQPGGRGNVGYHAADLIENTNGDLATLMNVHSTLGTITPGEGANYAAAQLARDEIREWIGNLQPNQITRGDPQFISAQWQHAREAWRVHSNLEDIENALQSAEWRRLVSGRGTNLNTLRQEIRKILDNDNTARRYTPEARAQMERVIEGDMARNILRKIAAFAPHGPVSAIPTLAATAIEGSGAGLAVAGGSFLAHFLQGRAEQRSVQQILDIIREGSPLVSGAQRRARARLLAPGRTAVGAARGALAAGADSPLAEGAP
jgi:hypothetical protein